MSFPEEVGGAGLSCYDHCLITQEIQYGCLGIGTSVTANNLAAMPVIIAGNEAQKKKYLGLLSEEPLYAAYACSEPDAGSDVAAMSSRFEK